MNRADGLLPSTHSLRFAAARINESLNLPAQVIDDAWAQGSLGGRCAVELQPTIACFATIYVRFDERFELEPHCMKCCALTRVAAIACELWAELHAVAMRCT